MQIPTWRVPGGPPLCRRVIGDQDCFYGYKFQPAGRADIAQLMQFMREYYAFDHLPFDENRACGALGTLVGDESLGRVWSICAAGTAIGYIVLILGYSLEYGGRDAFIDEIYIREHYRGQGIGTRALSFAQEMCRALGVRTLHLEVERANSGAYSVYRKVGFVDHDRYLMTKRISILPSLSLPLALPRDP